MSLAVENRPSPNHGERKSGPTDILLLHYTGMPDAEQALAWLCDPRSQVSSHYFIFEDGRVIALVPEERRAWHAGAGSWGTETDVNSRSIGIEIANPGHPGGLPEFPEPQVQALVALCRGIVARNAIPAHRVLAHSDVAPGRKLDPGERFPWPRFAAEGIGHWVEPAPLGGGRFFARGDAGQPVEALQAMLALYGYGIDVSGQFDARTEAVIAAFQRHFRPAQVDGIADRSTIETLHALLTALP
jgi:N-acetylmuramoyl-L-alanine amidase